MSESAKEQISESNECKTPNKLEEKVLDVATDSKTKSSTGKNEASENFIRNKSNKSAKSIQTDKNKSQHRSNLSMKEQHSSGNQHKPKNTSLNASKVRGLNAAKTKKR